MFLSDIICYRDENENAIVEGIDHSIKYYPGDFEWGYGGACPANLAYAILVQHLDSDEVKKLFQAFKWDVLAKLPVGGGLIKRTDIMAWVANHRKYDKTR